jgi:Immunity protein 50
MIEPPNYIAGFEKVVAAFGYWPSFHDAPVLSFDLSQDHIDLQLEAWEMTPEVDAKGFFVLAKQHEIGFRFSRIVSTNLDEFIAENILHHLTFSSSADFALNGSFDVELESAMGSDMCGEFTACCGEITCVRPTSKSS